MFSPSSSKRSAFTLIELLTVIAIMAILSSMLFPSFSRAREMARRSSCSSNMKQLGLGMIQYMADYDDRYPKAGNYQAWGNGGHWVAGTNNSYMAALAHPYTKTGNKANIEGGAIFPYVKNTQIFVCPSVPDGADKGLTYSMNCWLSGNSEVSVQSPTDIVLLVDEEGSSDAYFWADNNDNSSDHMTQIHNGGGNLLFADGHVKFYPFNRFPAGDNKDSGGTVNPVSKAAKTRNGTEQPRFYETGATINSCTFS